MTEPPARSGDLDAMRRRIAELLHASDAPLTRRDVADRLGIPPSTAAFHLERLAHDGRAAVEFRRLNGRTGPGAGRPAKLYRAADPRPGASDGAPRRYYALAGAVMADAIGRASAGDSPRLALRRAADEAGRKLGVGTSGIVDALERTGFSPRDEGADVVLGVCPFHRLAEQNPGVVCELNHALVCGMAAAAGDAPGRVHLDPGAGECCLRIAPAGASG